MAINTADHTLKYDPGNFVHPNWRPLLFIFLLLLLPLSSFAGNDDFADEQISVSIEIKNVGITEMPAIYHNKEVYLAATNVFDFIKVKNRLSPNADSVTGHYLNEQDDFVIDLNNNEIIYKNKAIKLEANEIISLDNVLYLKLKYFNTVFGLDGNFNFRRLWVTFTTNVELPVVREMRQELMRKNISRLKGDQTADTTIRRTHPLFHFGMADWAVTSTQQSQSYDDTRLNLGLGAVILGGETNVSLNYYNKQPFSELQQYYQWRYVNNDWNGLRQIALGKIFAQGISSLYAPVVGMQFSNAPTTNRRSYGNYTISDKAEPNWIVELYVNNILIDYKKTDASGFYTFEVPIVYGNTVVKLRFYGPYGEERTSQKYINIPFNFLPIHEFEYTASAGIVEDGQNSQFSRVTANYGLSGHITVGGGVEYLSSVTSGNTIPFINSSVRFGSRLMLSGEYDHSVRSRGILSYRLPSNVQLDLDYIKYAAGQTAIYYNYLEERKGVLSIPLHGKGYSLFARFTVDDITVPLSRYTNTEVALTGSVRSVGFNLTTYASFAQQYNPYLYSLGSISLILPAKINFTTQVEYDYKADKIAFVKFTAEKYLFVHGFLNASYQEFFTGSNEYFKTNYNTFLIGLRYDFSFARVSIASLSGSNKTYSRVESASGSFIFDAKTNYFNVNARNNVGKGGIVIQPFLDINCNGIRDNDEPIAPGLKLRINGGRVVYGKDSTIRIFDLEAYTKYFIELNTNSFDNIAWQLKIHTLRVNVESNNFTLVQVPVAVVGEVTGEVYMKGKDAKKGKTQGQILVCIYNSEGTIVARAMSEGDGYFDYIGLAPGSYTARIDPEQLKKLHLTANSIPFQVHTTKNNEGDVISGLEFILQ